MDGSRWAYLGGADCHLFVNESHNQISYVGTKPEWWFEYEGSSQPNRSSTGSVNS